MTLIAGRAPSNEQPSQNHLGQTLGPTRDRCGDCGSTETNSDNFCLNCCGRTLDDIDTCVAATGINSIPYAEQVRYYKRLSQLIQQPTEQLSRIGA